MRAPDLDDSIAAAKELYAKATPGEYTFRRQWNEGNCPTLTVGDVDEFGDYSAVTEDSFRSAAYIHNLFPNLVANWDRKGQRIAALEAENDWLRQRVAELEEGIRDYIEREKAFGERR